MKKGQIAQHWVQHKKGVFTEERATLSLLTPMGTSHSSFKNALTYLSHTDIFEHLLCTGY